jgi:phosphoesterase RecJ-like protein
MIWEYEHATKVFRVSLRSDCDEVDVSLIAKKFGGGGHRRAAGFSHTGASIEELLVDVEAPQGWKAEPA